MIEIIAIILQFIIFLLIFSFPFNPVILNNKLNSKKYFFGVFDTLLINAVFIFNFFNNYIISKFKFEYDILYFINFFYY